MYTNHREQQQIDFCISSAHKQFGINTNCFWFFKIKNKKKNTKKKKTVLNGLFAFWKQNQNKNLMY